MWAGTESAGVMRIARQGFLTDREESGLVSERTLQVLEDRVGNYWRLPRAAPRAAPSGYSMAADSGRFSQPRLPMAADGAGSEFFCKRVAENGGLRLMLDCCVFRP